MTVTVGRRLVLSLVLVVSAAVVPVAGVSASPPASPDHGLNASEFAPLWSHDDDAETIPTTNVSAIEALANGTDIAYSDPPRAVETWNRNDIEEFPDTGTDTSIYPPGTETTSSPRGRITDAYARVFAIQPSTRAYVSNRSQPLYVPQRGTVLATIDYRVDLPDDDTSGGRRVSYDLHRSRIEDVRAVSGARTIGTADPAHAVAVPYTGLSAGPHQVGVEARIEITVEKTVRTKHCEDEDDDGDEECAWNTNRFEVDEAVTVRDTRRVRRYSTLSAGYITQYPNGDMGVIAQQTNPWAGLSLPGNDSVAGIWQFYSGRDTQWDTLTVATDSGTGRRPSPAQPLQVYAYPSTGQTTLRTTDGYAPAGSLLQTRGSRRSAPTLPQHVDLSTANGTYNTTSQVAVRHPQYAPQQVRVQGLVAGTSRSLSSTSYATVETRAASITATVRNATRATLTVHVRLLDQQGRPITTQGYDGRVVVDGTQVETNATGEAVVTLPRSEQRLTVRYEPSPFWKRQPAYTAATDHLYPPSSFGGDMSHLVVVSFSVLLLWLPIYMWDKMLGLGLWPPWRGVR